MVWLPGKASVALSTGGLIGFLMISGQAPSQCWYLGVGLATAARLWPPPHTTIDSPAAPSFFGLLAVCQNLLAQASATIEKGSFLVLSFLLSSYFCTAVSPLHLLILLHPAKMKRHTQRKRVTFDRTYSSCSMYGCVLICIGFRNYREESPRVAFAFKSHTRFFWEKGKDASDSC